MTKAGRSIFRNLPGITLDMFKLRDLEIETKWSTENLKFQWDYYSELKYQRAKVMPQIRAALVGAAKGFGFSQWRRVVEYQYSLQPLSAKGSVISEVGGRFNIGDIDAAKLTAFPALYLASSHETALVECFAPIAPNRELSLMEFALRTSGSHTCVEVSGELESIIDIRDRDSLQPFIDAIAKFEVSPALVAAARKLSQQLPGVVRDCKHLQSVLTEPNWRQQPLMADVPHSCQLFGELAFQAGVEGILYDSVKGDGQCLAIFPENLAASSFVQLDGTPPDIAVPCRLDCNSWKRFV